MSATPMNTWCPCNMDAHEEEWAWDWDHPSCENCSHYTDNHGKCLGDRGWPILAAAGAEVARERGGKR